MIEKRVNIQEISDNDPYKPYPGYTHDKAKNIAENTYPASAYRAEDNYLYFNTDYVKLSEEDIRDRLRWGYQVNFQLMYKK